MTSLPDRPSLRPSLVAQEREVYLVRRQFFCILVLLGLLALILGNIPAYASDSYFSTRLGISLVTLQAALEKVAGPVKFAPRPGSVQGTQEARLPENTGFVQAGGGAGNLTTVVLWLPVDAKGKLAGPKARSFLEAFVELFTAESETVRLWVDRVLERAIADNSETSHIESQLLDEHQFKATYMPTLSPPMMSLAVVAAQDVEH